MAQYPSYYMGQDIGKTGVKQVKGCIKKDRINIEDIRSKFGITSLNAKLVEDKMMWNVCQLENSKRTILYEIQVYFVKF